MVLLASHWGSRIGEIGRTLSKSKSKSSTPNTSKPRKHRVTRRQPHILTADATALLAPTNMTTYSVSPAGSSYCAPQQVPTPPGPPNRAAPTTFINNESRGCFRLKKNNSWQGKHPFGMPRVDLSVSFRSSHLSAATFAPHGSFPYPLAGRIIVASRHWFVL
jgi:hypothetical protein